MPPSSGVAPRPRRQRADAVVNRRLVLEAAATIFAERGLEASVDAVAERAGVGKATVYRWWPSKGALVAEAIGRSLRVADPPETGDFRADLIAAVETSIANFAQPSGGVLITALAADLMDDPALLRSFLDDFVLPRRRVVMKLIARGVEEGYIPAERDCELLMDMWAGAVIYRGLMKHLPVTHDLARRLVDAVLLVPELDGANRGGAPASG